MPPPSPVSFGTMTGDGEFGDTLSPVGISVWEEAVWTPKEGGSLSALVGGPDLLPSRDISRS